MPRFDLYAGVWHPEYQGRYECADIEEATDYAKQLAINEYQSYEGSHGVLSYDECCEDVRESCGEEINEWTNEDFNNFYNETIENNIFYYATEVI